ncbi:MAG TPA: hypothetical protein VGL53_31505 [Bryobacteraceae bacterium]|jgi:hypothetical protein
MFSREVLALVVLCGSAHAAADPQLDALGALLTPMRGAKEPQDSPTRGATPALTQIKHELRYWIESQMSALTQNGETVALENKLNAEVSAAGLACGVDAKDPECPDWTQLGYLSKIIFRRQGSFLTLTTSVGIVCGFDDSAYLYRWNESEKAWRRVWESEQNTYTKDGYHPQNILSIKTSEDGLVLTLGIQPWCESNWHDVYYRLFRQTLSKPLVDGAEYAFEGWSIGGTLSDDEALVDFRIGSIDPGIHNRQAIRHYKIKGDVATRVDPIALGPRDFVEEWLIQDWAKQAAVWSEPAHREDLHRWHDKFAHRSAQNIPPTMHCPTAPDLWQVGFDLSDPPTDFDKPPVGTYFLVRWRPPYRFSMVSISAKADPRCTDADPDSDNPRFTLLPIP